MNPASASQKNFQRWKSSGFSRGHTQGYTQKAAGTTVCLVLPAKTEGDAWRRPSINRTICR
jgi:hypothetical protein